MYFHVQTMVYTHIDITIPTGIFDPIADHCIVLAMSNRFKKVIRQLQKDRPHSKVTLQINPGYHEKEDLIEKTSKADICHALAESFRFSLERGYERVLVLEDDFFLGTPNEVSATREATAVIAKFLEGKTFDTYNLGRVVFCGWPCEHGSWRALVHGTAHGVIYSSRFMRTYVNQHNTDPRPIIKAGNDLWWNRVDMIHYVYKDPLVFQTFPKTANRQHWNDPLKEFGISALGLDTHHQPGFSILNGLCKSSIPFMTTIIGMVAAIAGHRVETNLTQS